MLTGSAVVTGAAKGIGQAIAVVLLADGVTVVGVDQDADALAVASEQFRDTGNFLAVVGDVAKGGVESLTRQVAHEYAHENIRVNAIAPGAIQTGIDHIDHSVPRNVQAVVDAAVPVGWHGQLQDIANAALFLADPELSGYITSQVITVDGGFTIAGPNWQHARRSIEPTKK